MSLCETAPHYLFRDPRTGNARMAPVDMSPPLWARGFAELLKAFDECSICFD
jgi:hypothetical protein